MRPATIADRYPTAEGVDTRFRTVEIAITISMNGIYQRWMLDQARIPGITPNSIDMGGFDLVTFTRANTTNHKIQGTIRRSDVVPIWRGF